MVIYRINCGPRAGQKQLTLRGAPATDGQRRQRLCADIDMHHYPNCISGQLKIVSPIVEAAVNDKILRHLGLDPQPPPRAPANNPQPDQAW